MGTIEDAKRIYARLFAVVSDKFRKGQEILYDEMAELHPIGPDNRINYITLGPGVSSFRSIDSPDRLRFVAKSIPGGKIPAHSHPDCWEYVWLVEGSLLANGVKLSESGLRKIEFPPGDVHDFHFLSKSEIVVIFSKTPIVI